MEPGDVMTFRCPTPCTEGVCPGCPQQVTVVRSFRVMQPREHWVLVALPGGGEVWAPGQWLTKGET